MNLRFIDWIWHIRGSVPLAPGQSSDEAFERLDPLFRKSGTSHERADDTLTFLKKDPASQDKMSVFESGVLHIEKHATGSVLRYHLTSRVLLFCFLAPLLFLAIAQFTIAVTRPGKSPAEAAGKSAKASAAKKPEVKKPDVPMNPIDKALGAPAPEKPKKADKDDKSDDKPSPTPAYVFAAIFATLYVVGRILEDRLIKALFRKTLAATEPRVANAYERLATQSK